MAQGDVLIICEDDGYIALDDNSGGYPIHVSSPWNARHWRLLADAMSYRDKFPKRKWKITLFHATALWEVGKSASERETETDQVSPARSVLLEQNDLDSRNQTVEEEFSG